MNHLCVINIAWETPKVGTGAERRVIVDRVLFLCYKSRFCTLKPSAGMLDSSARASHRMLCYCFAPYIILDNPTCSLDRFEKCCGVGPNSCSTSVGGCAGIHRSRIRNSFGNGHERAASKLRFKWRPRGSLICRADLNQDASQFIPAKHTIWGDGHRGAF